MITIIIDMDEGHGLGKIHLIQTRQTYMLAATWVNDLDMILRGTNSRISSVSLYPVRENDSLVPSETGGKLSEPNEEKEILPSSQTVPF